MIRLHPKPSAGMGMSWSDIANRIRRSVRAALMLDMLSNSDHPLVGGAFAPKDGV